MILNNNFELKASIDSQWTDRGTDATGTGSGNTGGSFSGGMDSTGSGGSSGSEYNPDVGYDVALTPAISPVPMDWSYAKTAGKLGLSLGGTAGGVLGFLGGAAYGYSKVVTEEEAMGLKSTNNIEYNPATNTFYDSGPGGDGTISNSYTAGSQADPYGPLGSNNSGSVASGGQDNTLLGSAKEGISQLEAQREKIKSLYEPYYQSAVNEALPQMQALAQGGEIDFTPSRLYEYSKERGERNIRRTQAAKGQLKSSATEEKMSDLRSGLAEEEVDRLYQGQLSRLQLGAGAADAVGSANRSIGGNVSGLYTGLGADAYLSQQAEGQSRQSSYQGLASSLMGFAEYMEAS